MLILDDLHAADEPSLLLLRFLARDLSNRRVLLLAAYRNVDPTLADPLEMTLAELIREPATRAFELTGLAETELTRLIEVTTGQVPDTAVAAAVLAESEGNPLFAGEIARLLAAEGGLEHARAARAIPPGVKEVIRRRLRTCRRTATVS